MEHTPTYNCFVNSHDEFLTSKSEGFAGTRSEVKRHEGTEHAASGIYQCTCGKKPFNSSGALRRSHAADHQIASVLKLNGE